MKRPSQSQARRRKVPSGFTLIELLLVLAIIATLAAIVYPKFTGRTEQAKITQAQSQIANFSLALDAYEIDNGGYPRSLDALYVQPGEATNWRGPYMKGNAAPLDPWGSAYIYEVPGKHNVNGFDLMSSGPDMRAGTEDDITNWNGTSR